MDSSLQDLRHACRYLVCHRLVSGVAVVCVALGIAVSTTTFSMLDGLLLQSLPFSDADRIVGIGVSQPDDRSRSEPLLSYPDFREMREQVTAVADVEGASLRTVTVFEPGRDPERYRAALVTSRLFDMLGTAPALGRAFIDEDDRPGAKPVAILSDDAWRRRYEGDRGVLGRSVRIDGQAYTIVGVMPPRFGFPFTQQIWIPLGPMLHDSPRAERSILGFGRLKRGVSLDQARTQVKAVAERLAGRYSEDVGWRGSLRPLRDTYVSPGLRATLGLLMAAGTAVLLIGCANLANLLLAQSANRRRELALRAALGAPRWRIIRHLLFESLVLCVTGMALGIGVAWIGLKLFDRATSTFAIPYVIQWNMDGRVILFAFAMTLITGVACGLLAALRAVGQRLAAEAQSGMRGTTVQGNWMRGALVVSEVSLSLVLLTVGGLFLRAFFNVSASNGGITANSVMTMRLWLPEATYDSSEAIVRRTEDILMRLETIPGVEVATASGLIPLDGGSRIGGIAIEGRAMAPGEELRVRSAGVTAQFFRALGMRVQRGRTSTDHEALTQSGLAIVNQAMATRFWPKEDPTGRRFSFVGDVNGESFTIVGVIANFNNEGLFSEPDPLPSVYIPYAYAPPRYTGVMVRFAGDAGALTTSIRSAISAADPSIALESVRTMTRLRSDESWAYTFLAWMFGVLASIAIILAGAGLYGVLAYAVSQRIPEIGLRMAVGAGDEDVVRMLVKDGLRLCGIGIVFGLGGALAVAPLLRRLLYQVGPTDPVTFGAAVVLISLVGFLASYLPARVAKRVDPVRLLRSL